MVINQTLTALRDYCAELGDDAFVILPDQEAKHQLPMFLGQMYEPFRATIFGHPLRLLLFQRRERPSPVELETQAKLLARYLEPPIAFVFPALASYERNRLVKRRISFIVPYRQMFLPGTMIDLREVHSPARQPITRKALCLPAQLLFLHHLSKRRNEAPIALYQWATALGYSRMSISRAQQELVEAGLAAATNSGKTVVLRFSGDRKELWERALPRLRSPVQKKGFYQSQDFPPSFLNAGLTALAHYTDLAPGQLRTLAASRMFLRSQIEKAQVLWPDDEAVEIERWWYCPIILSEDNRTVDRLSLYLSLREAADERVQTALAQLLEGVKW